MFSIIGRFSVNRNILAPRLRLLTVALKHKIAIFLKTAQTILIKFRYDMEIITLNETAQALSAGTCRYSLYMRTFVHYLCTDFLSPISFRVSRHSDGGIRAFCMADPPVQHQRIGDTHLSRLTGSQCYQRCCGAQASFMGTEKVS
jgi:hypothetical protein